MSELELNQEDNTEIPLEYIEVKKQCDVCKNTEFLINKESGLTTCLCGNVIGNEIDFTPEWRYYGTDDNKNGDPTRCGIPIDPHFPRASMSTVIGNGGGKNFSSTRRLQIWSLIPYEERAIFQDFESMKIKTQNTIVLKNVMDLAESYLYEIIKKSNLCGDENILTRGIKRESLRCACVLHACKIKKIALSASDIAKLYDVDEATVTRGYKLFMEIMQNKNINITYQPNRSQDFISKFAYQLQISPYLTKVAQAVAKRAEQLGIVSNHAPLSISAGILFFMNKLYNLGISKEILKNTCDNKSYVTVSKVSKKLEENIQAILPICEKKKLGISN